MLLKRVKERDDLNALIKDIQARAKEDAQAVNIYATFQRNKFSLQASRRQNEAESQIKALRDRMAAAEAHYSKEIQNTHKKYIDDMDSVGYKMARKLATKLRYSYARRQVAPSRTWSRRY